MIDETAIRAIFGQYEKYGWQPRRVLLTADLRKTLANSLEMLFGNIEIVAAELDAAWFSRPSPSSNATAWELRHLSSAPFALIEVVENDLSDDEREEILQITELRLHEKLEESTPNFGAGH